MAKGSKRTKADLMEIETAYYQWQWIRRKPDYIASYAKYKRDEISGEQLLEEYGFDKDFLKEPLDPHNDQQQIHCYKKHGREKGYVYAPETKKVDLGKKHESVYLRLFHPTVQLILADSTKYQLLEDAKHLTVKIDMTQKRRLIKSKLDLILDYVGTKGGRDRMAEWDNQLKVWDLRKQRKTYREIAAEIYPKEKLDTSEGKVEKQFKAAYEKIMGQKYDRRKYKDLFKDKDALPRTCQDCPNRNTCTEPCPDILPYVEQDEVKQREWLKADPHRLYSEDRQAD